jgi:osmotically inducible protein OsmC
MIDIPPTNAGGQMKRTATAAWTGGLKDGKGKISTQSGVLSDNRYGFSTRFEGEPGTNPEELIAAAHAGCFTMALSAQLGEAGITAERLETTATVTLDKSGDGFANTDIHLDLWRRFRARTGRPSKPLQTRPRKAVRYRRCSTRTSR